MDEESRPREGACRDLSGEMKKKGFDRMEHGMNMTLRPLGVVKSSLRGRDDCPRQGFDGGVEAGIVLDPEFSEGLDGLEAGREILLFTWLHQAERDVLKVHPRGNREAPLKGVFATRSPARPNPIGLHRVKILAKEGCLLRVAPLEVLDGTPVLDIKPVIDAYGTEN